MTAWILLVFIGLPARAAQFNDILPGAKPMGMGMAYTAVADDPYALYFNPAGLAGADFTQFGGSFGRMLSPTGPLAFESVVYTRPFPARPGSTVGAAFYNERQSGGGDKDELTFHYSEGFRLPQLHLTRPLKAGGNLKFVNVGLPGKGSKFAPGLDAGLLLESNFGLKGGVSFLNLTPNLGVENPWMTLALAYTRARRVTFAGDLRIRRNLTEYFPGVEVSFLQGLLKARMGKGLALDGVKQAAFGFGANFSPILLDVAMTVPFNGFTRPGGAYQLSLNYRFGAPPFTGRFVGTAARQAEDLKVEIAALTDRKNSLLAQAATAQSNQEAAEGSLRALESRLKAVEEQLYRAERKLQEKTYEIRKPRPAPETERVPKAPAQPKAEPFPRRHKVLAGDTLRSIAQKHYGDPNLWEIVYDANRDKVERGLPQEGAELAIPPPR